ncbi:MAG TPA: hypothetical protein VJQ43_06250, partial [Thermoplasmata archaeon]|nr:hypothetical protein [Thermoplasmata archaeon]
LLNSPGGFWSSWSDPVLLAALAAVAAAALLIAAMRGAFARVPPTGPALEPERGTDGAFEAIRELDGLKAQERRLRHSLRGLGRDDPERTSLGAQIEELETRAAAIVAAREAEERAIE